MRRPRGRPPGARTQVLRHAGALGMHHFAFLRSWLLGLDLRDAWQRYLAFSELSADVRHIEHRRAALLRQVLDAARQLNLGLPADQQISAQIALLAQPPRDAASAPLPTLDEFIEAQGLDREFYSEAELLQEYRQFHHLDSLAEEASSGASAADAPGAGAAGSAQVRALNRIEALLAREPGADDRLDLWLSPALAALLRGAGIATLGALADTVRVYGRHWHRRAKRLGARRAAHLVDWLAPQAERFGHPIPAEAREPVQRQRARLAAGLQRHESAPRFAIVPLERLAVPPSLSGRRPAPGLDAGGGGQRPGPGDDLSALRAWLRTHEASPATHRAYAKEVERFYLWCLLARGKPLSLVDGTDCDAYERFLGDVPPDWVNPHPAPRIDPAWRPFRGPLSASSARYALGVLRTMFDGLCAAGHLAGNPLRGPRLPARAAAPTPTSMPAPAPPLQRAFTEPEWIFLLGQLATDADPDPLAPGQAGARRIELLLRMLAGTGLRLAEIAGATSGDLRQVAVEGEIGATTVITVTGRRGDRPRDVPVGEDVLALIQQHHADALRAAGPLAALPCPLPIVCALGEPPQRWTAGSDGSVQLSAAPAPAVRALGRAGIYLTLKRFFRRASARASAVDGLSRERLVAASTHWLRHTFGRRGAAAGMPVEALREALGHVSLASTGLYLDAGGAHGTRAPRRTRHDTGA